MKDTTILNFENNFFSANIDKFPFIYVTFSGQTYTDEDFVDYINYMDKIYAQQQQHVLLYDARKANYLKSKQRIDLGNWTKNNKEVMQKLCKGIAFVMSSALIKIMLKGIFMVQPPPYEYIVVDDMEKAEDWIKKQLEK